MVLLDWIEGWTVAAWLRESGTVYLLVNAAHILGIGLLLGAILPLDLALAGWVRRTPPLAELAPYLSRCAAIGLMLALVTGTLLWSVKPREYLANPAFLVKMGLLGLTLLDITAQHWQRSWARVVSEGEVSTPTRLIATLSALGWLGVLIAGRWIGFL